MLFSTILIFLFLIWPNCLCSPKHGYDKYENNPSANIAEFDEFENGLNELKNEITNRKNEIDRRIGVHQNGKILASFNKIKSAYSEISEGLRDIEKNSCFFSEYANFAKARQEFEQIFSERVEKQSVLLFLKNIRQVFDLGNLASLVKHAITERTSLKIKLLQKLSTVRDPLEKAKLKEKLTGANKNINLDTTIKNFEEILAKESVMFPATLNMRNHNPMDLMLLENLYDLEWLEEVANAASGIILLAKQAEEKDNTDEKKTIYNEILAKVSEMSKTLQFLEGKKIKSDVDLWDANRLMLGNVHILNVLAGKPFYGTSVYDPTDQLIQRVLQQIGFLLHKIYIEEYKLNKIPVEEAEASSSSSSTVKEPSDKNFQLSVSDMLKKEYPDFMSILESVGLADQVFEFEMLEERQIGKYFDLLKLMIDKKFPITFVNKDKTEFVHFYKAKLKEAIEFVCNGVNQLANSIPSSEDMEYRTVLNLENTLLLDFIVQTKSESTFALIGNFGESQNAFAKLFTNMDFLKPLIEIQSVLKDLRSKYALDLFILSDEPENAEKGKTLKSWLELQDQVSNKIPKLGRMLSEAREIWQLIESMHTLDRKRSPKPMEELRIERQALNRIRQMKIVLKEAIMLHSNLQLWLVRHEKSHAENVQQQFCKLEAALNRMGIDKKWMKKIMGQHKLDNYQIGHLSYNEWKQPEVVQEKRLMALVVRLRKFYFEQFNNLDDEHSCPSNLNSSEDLDLLL